MTYDAEKSGRYGMNGYEDWQVAGECLKAFRFKADRYQKK